MDVSTGKPQSKCFPKFWGKKSQCTLWHFSIDILFQIALLVMDFLFFSLSYHMQNQSKISVSNTIFENLSKQMIGIPPDLFLKGCDVIRRKHSRFFQSYRQDRNKYWFNKFFFQREDIEMIFKIHSKLEYSSKGKRK